MRAGTIWSARALIAPCFAWVLLFLSCGRVGYDAYGAPCGNGEAAFEEQCDDGNLVDGDGCSSACEVEPGFLCPQVNTQCLSLVNCGNGRLEGDETCDDGNVLAGDGCSEGCALEPGWTCPGQPRPCLATRCGDGERAGSELCDDGNTVDADGCSAQCKVEDGYVCGQAGSPCMATNCGDGVTEGGEQCDDSNAEVGDGCTPFCLREPQCSNGACLALCGDGVRADAELCDDGNNLSGDGCDQNCAVETGFSCEELPVPEPTEMLLPVTVRDFIAACDVDVGDRRLADDEVGAIAPFGHRDFECFIDGLLVGMVASTLDAEGKPLRVANSSTFSDESFSQWYRSDENYNRTMASSISLPAIGGGAFAFDSASFFPITGLGFDSSDCQGAPCEHTHADGDGSGEQNFNFTSETHWWFEYTGDETLTFSGDDDVWVFINGHLAVDIGGVHPRSDGSVNLGDPSTAAMLGLTIGGTYEGALFHAERHVVSSAYGLTLTNFARAPSVCTDFCGDGVISTAEECDDGSNNGQSAGYGGCSADCRLEAYCGDGAIDELFGENCDDGLNLGGSADACAPGCQSLGPRCGDGVMQLAAGEQCDDGNVQSDDGCDAECRLEL